MKKVFTTGIIFILLASMLMGCVTRNSVLFETNVPGATVQVDGVLLGETEFTAVMSNGVWKKGNVVIEKEGYKTLHTTLEKEIVLINLIFGWILWWPSLLWCYGPSIYKHLDLQP
ncbi:MAG: PEGA domain-containing protein [Treponema sp.]|jgi:hypothetical protein|nr:PEGA domain-containing protein [Treponema sp.]